MADPLRPLDFVPDEAFLKKKELQKQFEREQAALANPAKPEPPETEKPKTTRKEK
jgi:hypothetical protein